MKIALATCATLPEHDPDEQPLLAALRGAGHDAETLPWDAVHDVSAFDAVVLRATWNYYRSLDAFVAWLEKTDSATTLLNPLEVVRWNMDKAYLREIEAAGVGIVPTAWMPAGEREPLADVLGRTGWDRIVIKPRIGAGSYLTELFDATDLDAAQAYLDEHAARDMMVQRYMPTVATQGERAIIWIGGSFSHAVHKHPRFAGEDEKVERAELSEDLISVAERVLAVAPKDLLYARIDVIYTDEGEPVLSELELLEPSLYFDLGGEQSVQRMVEALEAKLGAGV